MTDISIREARTHDLKAIQKLSTELAHSDSPYDKDVDLDWADTNDGKKYFKEKIQKIEGICWVAALNDEIIGYATASIKETPSWRLVKVSELENLFVSEQYRSRGIGKLFMDTFMNWSKKMKVNKVSTCVFYPNNNAIEFYKRYGLKQYDINLEMPI